VDWWSCGDPRREQRLPAAGRRGPELRGERGQVLVLVAVAMVALLAAAGLAIDVGYAYYAQRSLQASADAAALAGAQELPNPDAAAATARNYGGEDGARNARANVPGVRTTVTTRCLRSAPGCNPANAIVVTERTTIPTFFARVVGIDSFDVGAKATACSPCSAKELDIMLVLDRTGSMCQDNQGRADPDCTDLENAREGMGIFLGFLDPALDKVGLAVLPPAPTVADRCVKPETSFYNDEAATYVIVPLSNDYSDLVSTIGCQKGNGRTSYANALASAQSELERNGRPDVKDVIVFLSDGAANIGPTYYDPGSEQRMQPCRRGVTVAQMIAAKGTLVYSIGYDLNALGGDANRCTSWAGADEAPPITAYSALEQIASERSNFYDKPDAGELNTIFTKIAADIAKPAARLLPDDAE
jgi:Putative Flp pilus-assembly TadE/G-like